ncbi:hypothetical protein [Rhodopila sp.]|jgi:hypothetical protein|uniref:hypothetical protein n=1 Tax=Rhodopila sp. TaxID=2480087 RepID=UPI002B84B33E|nr:hypothetical protein [Rhodopila sp.]HVZ09066.1 hypothetical protein [Rhodopila sp.]
MSALISLAAGLSGAARLAVGRPDGVSLVRGGRQTAIHSFLAIPIAMPSVVCRLLMSWAADGMPTQPGEHMARELILFVVGWLLFVEASHAIASAIGRQHAWLRFVALWNWCNVIEGVLVVAGGLPALAGAPPMLVEAAEVITIGWALWLEWYATRLTLNVSTAMAIGFVVIDQLIGILLAMVAISLTG